MTTKKNHPGKSPSGKGVTSGPKKPYATLNLKATELKPKSGEPGKPGAVTGTQKPSPASSASKRTPDPAKTTPPNAGPAKSGSTPASAGKDTKANGDNKTDAGVGAASKAAPKPKASSGSKIANTLSHLTAGALGGFLAFFAGDAIAPRLAQLGIPLPSSRADAPKVTANLQTRLQALEAQATQPATSDLGVLEAQINAAEAKLAQLDALVATVTVLQERQTELVTEVEKAGAQTEAGGALTAINERVAGLETKLTTLQSAAGNGDTGSNLANLAAITGRLVDLETTLNNQMTALRAGLSDDIQSRISTVAEASEAAKSGAQRMDRRLATISTDQARLSQRLEALKADTVRLDEAMRIAAEQTGTVQSALDGFKGDMKKTVSKLATREDVDTAVTTVTTQVATLKHDVGQVVRSESERKTNARRIVLSLELGNLKRALDRGDAYAVELAEVKTASAGTLDLSKLEAYEETGVPTLATLETTFRPVAHAILDAAREPVNGSFVDKMLAGARSIVKIRKVNHSPDDTSPEAVVGRMDKALEAGHLDQVLKASQVLPEKAMKPASEWLKKVEARRSVGIALGEIETQLKASLSGTKSDLPAPQTPAPKSNQPN